MRRYLREFLSDPRVIDLSPLGRWLLLNLFILLIRPARSAKAYRKIWGAEGSPLLHHSRKLAEAVSRALDGELLVQLAMRYGRPSLAEAMAAFHKAGVESITVLPLYPQYAASSTGSTVARAYELAAQGWDPLPLRVVPPFFHMAGFLDAFAEVARPALASAGADHVLFSFHGLPERQVKRSAGEGSGCRFDGECCAVLSTANANCYRAQSFHTAQELAARLGLEPGQYSVGFQSRLGRTPWIKPHTDVLLAELPGARSEGAGGGGPLLRGGLPGDAGGDRHPRRGHLPGRGWGASDAGALSERAPRVGGGGGPTGAGRGGVMCSGP